MSVRHRYWVDHEEFDRVLGIRKGVLELTTTRTVNRGDLILLRDRKTYNILRLKVRKVHDKGSYWSVEYIFK